MAYAAAHRPPPPFLTGAGDRRAGFLLTWKATNPQPVDIPDTPQRKVTIGMRCKTLVHRLRKWVPWSPEYRP